MIRSQVCLNHLFWLYSDTRFGTYLYSAGIQHEKRLKSIDYEQCALFYFIFSRRLTREFASAKTNAIQKYGEDLEKINLNRPGKRKLGQGTNYGTEKAYLAIF